MAEIYDTKALAHKLGVKERTIRLYLKEKKLTGFKVGRDWRFTDEDLQHFIEQQRQETTAERTP